MGQKGMDFKHKEVINIKDGKRLRICSRCLCRLRKWNNYFYNGCKIENRCNNSEYQKENTFNNCKHSKDRNDTSFAFERKHLKKNYITKQNKNRTGYVVNEKYVYDVVCKVEL